MSVGKSAWPSCRARARLPTAWRSLRTVDTPLSVEGIGGEPGAVDVIDLSELRQVGTSTLENKPGGSLSGRRFRNNYSTLQTNVRDQAVAGDSYGT